MRLDGLIANSVALKVQLDEIVEEFPGGSLQLICLESTSTA